MKLIYSVLCKRSIMTVFGILIFAKLLLTYVLHLIIQDLNFLELSESCSFIRHLYCLEVTDNLTLLHDHFLFLNNGVHIYFGEHGDYLNIKFKIFKVNVKNLSFSATNQLWVFNTMCGAGCQFVCTWNIHSSTEESFRQHRFQLTGMTYISSMFINEIQKKSLCVDR